MPEPQPGPRKRSEIVGEQVDRAMARRRRWTLIAALAIVLDIAAAVIAFNVYDNDRLAIRILMPLGLVIIIGYTIFWITHYPRRIWRWPIGDQRRDI